MNHRFWFSDAYNLSHWQTSDRYVDVRQSNVATYSPLRASVNGIGRKHSASGHHLDAYAYHTQPIGPLQTVRHSHYALYCLHGSHHRYCLNDFDHCGHCVVYCAQTEESLPSGHQSLPILHIWPRFLRDLKVNKKAMGHRSRYKRYINDSGGSSHKEYFPHSILVGGNIHFSHFSWHFGDQQRVVERLSRSIGWNLYIHSHWLYSQSKLTETFLQASHRILTAAAGIAGKS